MHFVDMIIKKRDGQKLSAKELSYFVEGVTNASLPDYQISAFLMAILFSSLDAEETAALTMAMANSGSAFDLSAVPGFKVDKHSTGGVADTTTLILAPLVASAGVPVVKMSGKGLGFSGGTLDKLASIPNFCTEVSQREAIAYAKQSQIVIMSQSENLTPADQKLYALRDVTGTVESLPLIASSIMSKKIAAGADGIVLDVKCGSGAFMKDESSARALATLMVDMGKHTGRKVRAVISSMEQPLGSYIGNSLEVIEAIEVLKGNTAGDLLAVSLLLGAHMLVLAQKVSTVEEGKSLLLENIQNGKGLLKLKELLQQQGGNPTILEDYSLLPHAKRQYTLKAIQNGYITSMNTAQIGRASLETGAGRAYKNAPIDYGAGIILKKRIGDFIASGETLAEIYSETDEKCKSAANLLSDAIHIEDNVPLIPPLILDVIE